jgi:hypothetical protein
VDGVRADVEDGQAQGLDLPGGDGDATILPAASAATPLLPNG